MSHHHYSDSQLGEEREFYGVTETTDGEHDYFEHIRPPRASLLNTTVTIGAIVLILSIAFGYRVSTAPVRDDVPRPVAAKMITEPPADSCADLTPYAGRDC